MVSKHPSTLTNKRKRQGANARGDGDQSSGEPPRQQQRVIPSSRQVVYALGSVAAPHRELGGASQLQSHQVWFLIASKAPLAAIQDACRRYPDQVQRPSRGRGGGGTLLHRACERGASPDVLQYLLDQFPCAARVLNLKQALPIHCYFGHCLHSGVQPSLSLVQSLMEYHPASCLAKPALQDRDCPLNESLFFSIDIVQCMVKAFLCICREQQGLQETSTKEIQDLIIPQENYQGLDLTLTKDLATALAPIMPYCLRLTCQTKSWTLQGFVRLMQSLHAPQASLLLQDLEFEAFPSDLIADHVSAQEALAIVLQRCNGLRRMTCASRFPDEDSGDGQGGPSDLCLFGRGMRHVLPHVSDQTTFVLGHFGIHNTNELYQFLITMAPTKVVLADLIADGEEDEEKQTQSIREEGSQFPVDAAQCQVEHLKLKACALSPGTLTRVLSVAARFPRLRRLALDMIEPDVDITEAVVALFENQSPVQHLAIGRGMVNRARVLQVLNTSNNTALEHFKYIAAAARLTENEQDDADCTRQIKYLTYLNHFGRAQVRDDKRMSCPQFVALLQGVSESPLSSLGIQAIHFGLLREAPHLWSK